MDTKDLALKAIREVHTDTSKSLEENLDDLQEIRDEVEILCEAVEEDIERNMEEGEGNNYE